MKYRKKPLVIEAFKLGYDRFPIWFIAALDVGGEMIANRGDYIIKGIKDEIYPCKAAIFEETYEKVLEDDADKNSVPTIMEAVQQGRQGIIDFLQEMQALKFKEEIIILKHEIDFLRRVLETCPRCSENL